MNNKTETKTALEPDSLSAGINKTKKFIMASATDMNEYAEQEKAKAAAILKQKVAIIAWVINLSEPKKNVKITVIIAPTISINHNIG